MKIITNHYEPNYDIGINGKSYTELIFRISGGKLYKGTRWITDSPLKARKAFLEYVKADKNERNYDFEEVSEIKWLYSSDNVIEFTSKGKIKVNDK